MMRKSVMMSSRMKISTITWSTRIDLNTIVVYQIHELATIHVLDLDVFLVYILMALC